MSFTLTSRSIPSALGWTQCIRLNASAGPSRRNSTIVPPHGYSSGTGETTGHLASPSSDDNDGEASRGQHRSARPGDLDFDEWDNELRRRMRKSDAKRRQRGADFVDHLLITVRGGKGGSGAAALAPSHRGTGPPSGGNGGPGGSVYLRTSPHLTSLARVGKRQIGQQGGSGSGSYKNGKRGEDVIITVPVGTIVKELRREGIESAWAQEDAEAGIVDSTAKRQKRRERFFLLHPTGEARETELRYGEDVLRREGFFRRTPTAEQEPFLSLDISSPLSSPVLLAQGGRGGLGNPHFQLANHPSSRLASRGYQPPTQTFALELKLLADVGLVGLPNAGKSTLLCALSNRKAEVADYQFTTLNPQVGVVRVYDDGSWSGVGEGGVVYESEVERNAAAQARLDGEYMPTPKEQRQRQQQAKTTGAVETDHLAVEQSTRETREKIETVRFTISDNPGLLPHASQNVGLGHSFLRSIERSLALVYVIDLSRPDPAADVRVLQHELNEYKTGLSDRAVAVVLNKADEVGEEEGRERVERVKEVLAGGGGRGGGGGESGGRRGDGECEILVMSGKYGLGVGRLVRLLSETIVQRRKELVQDQHD